MDRLRRIWPWGRKKNDATNRFVFVGHAIPEGAKVPSIYDHQRFPDNEIVTSKYTIWNFLPKNLFEQFRRIANFYFLCIGILTMVSDSPVSPLATFAPLLFVVAVTGIKQGYEDFLRHKNDSEVNVQLLQVVRNGKLQEIKSREIHVGDVIKIEEEESFPCDMVLLSSSNKEGKCYITTANLDGETNYKIKLSPKLTREFDCPEKLDHLRAHMEYQQPTVNLYRFAGTMTVYQAGRDRDPETTSLGLDNILLRGCRLKDTDYVYGCAVYTGRDTKISLNSVLTGIKFSTVEKSMNYFLLIFICVLLLEVVVCTLQKYHFDYTNLDGADYLGLGNGPATLHQILGDAAAFMVIFSYLIPISLYVTLEMQKFMGSFFFGWDEDLYCPDTDERAVCNTSDLNEELGQVQYLLTDKTGTLTENLMEFRHCSVNGRKYVEHQGRLMFPAEEDGTHLLPLLQGLTPDLEHFFIALSLCHTASIVGLSKILKRNTLRLANGSRRGSTWSTSSRTQLAQGDYEYQASSPDEKALVEACQRFGIVYCGEVDDVCTVKVGEEKRKYNRLHVLEFDSDRKRMSVIVQFPDGSIWLLCKGAESTVLRRCIAGPVTETENHIKDYAILGLRTLAVAARQLSVDEYESVKRQLQEAHQSLTDREGQITKAFDAIESDMTLLGATGVEDQLQEGVPETLEALKAAGIKVWILTGDKLETAVNIAFSCGHFKRGMEILELSGAVQAEEVLLVVRDKILNNRNNRYGMVIDGQCLAEALLHHRILLAEVVSYCQAVVCCRMSPIQKAEVVKLVKSLPGKPTTAAIGDGANDISMIQEAHIGLGIMGKEGRQAARCSDFAFARFRFLPKVLLVHGQWYYSRVSTLVQYFFYKNVAFATPLVFFSIFNAYSAQPLYTSFIFAMYNTTFAALPILVFSVLEQNFNAQYLLSNLHLYRHISCNANMIWSQFFKWNLLGLWHALAIYVGTHLLFHYESDVVYGGQPLDLTTMGTIICKSVVWVVNLKLLVESRHWSFVFVLSVFVSVALGFGAIMFFFSGVYMPLIFNIQMLWIFMVVEASATSWLLHALLVIVCLLPDFLIGMIESHRVRNGGFSWFPCSKATANYSIFHNQLSTTQERHDSYSTLDTTPSIDDFGARNSI